MTTVCDLFATYTGHFTKALIIVTKAADEAGEWSPDAFEKQWDTLTKSVALPFRFVLTSRAYPDYLYFSLTFLRFEKNFNHHTTAYLEIVGYTASRENASLLPLHVRLSHLKIPTSA